MQHALNRKNQKGFTLMELAVGLLVASLIMAAGLHVYNAGKNQDAVLLTNKRMDRLIQVLAQYADANGRLPCPADPSIDDELFGWERGVDQALVADVVTPRPPEVETCRHWAPAGADEHLPEGIVPFLSLGLKDEDARDGWGRYFTYAVSPVFAQINDETSDDPVTPTIEQDTGDVHVRCLNPAWMEHIDDGIGALGVAGDGAVNGDEVFDNMSAIKAKFCCARDGDTVAFDTTTDLEITFASNGNVLFPDAADTEIYNLPRDTTRYQPVNPTAVQLDAPYGSISSDHDGPRRPHEVDYAANPIAAVAYVLVSHGVNGYGSYMASNNDNRYFTSAGSDAEEENADGDQTFAEGPPGGVDASGYDDIVVWRTQISLMADAGSSCAIP